MVACHFPEVCAAVRRALSARKSQSSPNSHFALTVASSMIHYPGSHKILVGLMSLTLIFSLNYYQCMCVVQFACQDTCEAQRTTLWSQVSLPTFM